MFIETSAKAGYNVCLGRSACMNFEGGKLKLQHQVKALFRKIGHALPGMDNGMGEGQKDQSKLLPSEERAIFIFTKCTILVTKVDLSESSSPAKQDSSFCAC